MSETNERPSCSDIESLGLIPIVFQFADQYRSSDMHTRIAPLTIVRMISPFYDGEKWAVRWLSSVLGKDGEFMIEPSGGSRDQEFYAQYRFDTFEDAYNAAKKAKHKMELNNG